MTLKSMSPLSAWMPKNLYDSTTSVSMSFASLRIDTPPPRARPSPALSESELLLPVVPTATSLSPPNSAETFNAGLTSAPYDGATTKAPNATNTGPAHVPVVIPLLPWLVPLLELRLGTDGAILPRAVRALSSNQWTRPIG